MLLHKLKLAAISLFVLAAVATGAGWLARSMAIQEIPRGTRRPRVLSARVSRPRPSAGTKVSRTRTDPARKAG